MPTGVSVLSLNADFQLEFSLNVTGWTTIYPPSPYPPYEAALFEHVTGLRRLRGTLSPSGTLTYQRAYGYNGNTSAGENIPVTYDMAGKDYIELVRQPVPFKTPDSNLTMLTGILDPVLGGAVVQFDNLVAPVRSNATQPSFTPETFDAGTPISIKWTGASSAYTHDIFYTFGSKVREQIFSNQPQSSTGLSYTPPLSLLSEIPNAVSAPYTITMVTRQGDATIGEQTFQGTLRAPSSEAPTVASYNLSDANSSVSAIVDSYVQGLSILSVDAITATPKSGSTIVNTRLDFEGQSLRVGDTKQILASGTLPVTARAWDSRGLVGSLAGTISVLPYNAPTVTGLTVFRSDSAGNAQDDGEYIRIAAMAQAASLMNGTERNSLTIQVETRPYGTSTWTVRNTINVSGLVYNSGFTVDGGGIFSKTDSFDVRFTASDKFNNTIVLATVAKGEVTLDLQRNGVGVGKLWTQGSVDAAGQMYQNNGAAVVDAAQLPAKLAMHWDTGVARAATTSRYWEFWQDTDGTKKLYVGNTSGGWRQYSGEITVASRAWDSTQTGGGVTVVGRTDSITIPTVLEANEKLLIQSTDVGSGFGFISGSNITRNVSNTTLTIRFMQLMVNTQQPLKFVWQIVQI